MKYVIFLVLMHLSNICLGDPPKDVGVLVITRKNNSEYSWLLTKENLKKSIWDGFSDTPIKMPTIIHSAKESIQNIYGIKDGYVLREIRMALLVGTRDSWYYVIDFDQPYDKKSDGPSLPLRVIVRMDGSVMLPTSVKKLAL